MTEPFLPRGLCYVNWDFGIPELDAVEIEFTIHSPLARQPALYFQLYDFAIGGIGQYLGLQTDLIRPTPRGGVWSGKCLIHSRWGQCSIVDARVEPDGWLEAASHEGNFVGVRRPFDWGPGNFLARLALVDSDPTGDWFGFTVRNLQTGAQKSVGSLRFPRTGTDRARIANGGGTWIECYHGARGPSDLPYFHVSITSVVALLGKTRHPAIHARSTYADYPGLTQVDVECDSAAHSVHMRCGHGVATRHPAGAVF